MKRHLAHMLLLLAVFALPIGAQTADEKTVKSSDGSLLITVPSDWSKQELNDVAEVQLGNEEQNVYLLILIEKKDDLFGWNIERHSYVTLGKLLANVASPKITGPKPIKINGIPALQYEVRGASGGNNIVYLHTTIETSELFAQVLAWTVPSQESATRAKLEKAIMSIRVAH